MADYREIARRHPAVRDYLRHRKWVKRGDVTAYAPNMETASFSTDAYGYRHSVLDGARFGLSAAFDGEAWGLALGSSHVFGFGLPSDADTIPSQISARTGVRCVNVSFPESNLRALHSAALRIVSEAKRPPEFIACFAGGDLTRYCFTRRCDALFGPPDFTGQSETPPAPGGAEEEAAFRNLLAYVRFWLGQNLAVAKACGAHFLPPLDSTLFDKAAPSEAEKACKLGEAWDEASRLRFDAYRLRHGAYEASGMEWAESRGLLVRTDKDAMGFIDEFHYDAASCGRMADALAAALPA